MMLKNLALAAGIALFATGCSVLPEAKPIDFYTLQPARVTTSDSVQLSNIRIAEPELTDALQLERIVRITDQGSVLAYPNAKWSTSIATLWQSWLLDALWRDSRFEHISSAQQGLDSDWQLSGRLQSLHIEETSAGSIAVVRYDAQLIDVQQRKIIKSESFTAHVPVAGEKTSQAIAAISAASLKIGESLLEWLAASEL
ncbi:ABC-type transport auxiliary lipoprotein family protein [Pseudidiomarina andamanensis]|uniref:ABC-type transport auxiliary lipoprotein component domain-containing protein n=1 Tax=Pseudidiomarina andamanensis TaxID=1940690 RepID=A0AA92ERM1_9GAMM|nr:ABC-type transport auxiliary lipoprotein family protein [Pseudidiomarina andamanensis]MDS0218668.1 ABC-type transport auxiliary lipoprotein family protein [Pseudidiomarina andamanensis]QGT95532.1 hypothetical protein D3795_04765 [Pseudidiomarina andamanensis]